MESSGKNCTVWSKELFPDRRDAEERLERQALSHRLDQLMAEAHAALPQWGKKLHLSVADAGVTTGYLEFPRLEADEQDVAVTSAAAREIPQNLKEVKLFQIPVPALSNDPQRQGVFFVSVPLAAVQSRSEIFSQMGYEVSEAEPELLALVRGFNRNSEVRSGDCVLLIDIGFRHTTVVLLCGGHPYFSRSLQFGGKAFTYALQVSEQTSWSEAEASKRGYDAEHPDFRLGPFLQRWSADMKKTLDFVRSKFPTVNIQKLQLTGGGSRWNGLGAYLQQHLQLPVEQVAWQKIQPSLKGEHSSPALHTISLGLVSR